MKIMEIRIGDEVRGRLPNGAMVRGEIEEIRDGRVSIKDVQNKLWTVCRITVKSVIGLPKAIVTIKKASANSPYEQDANNTTVTPIGYPDPNAPAIAVGGWTEHNETSKVVVGKRTIEEVEQCPFCDGTADLIANSQGMFFIRCGKCDAQGPSHKRPGSAVRFWNERVEGCAA